MGSVARSLGDTNGSIIPDGLVEAYRHDHLGDDIDLFTAEMLTIMREQDPAAASEVDKLAAIFLGRSGFTDKAAVAAGAALMYAFWRRQDASAALNRMLGDEPSDHTD